MQNFAKSNFVKTVLRGNTGRGMKCFWQRGIQKVFCNVTTHCKMKIASWRSKDFGYSDTTPNLCYLQCLSGCLGTKTLIILLVLLIEIFYFMKTLEPMSQSIRRACTPLDHQTIVLVMLVSNLNSQNSPFCKRSLSD